MRAKGYGSYRGRSRFKTFLKILVIVVLILVILGAAAAVYLQQFLVVTPDGVRLELPFLQQQEPEVEPTPSAAPSEPPVELVTPTPEPEALHPTALPTEALYDGTAVSQIEAAGGDCALFDMKEDSGALHYISELELAVAAGLSADDPALNAAIQGLNGTEGLYTVARVSCFKDHDVTNYDRSLAILTNSGYRWTDPEGIRWISPTSADVRDYLTGICVELAQLGFDEILLDNAGYPAEGNLGYIRVGEAYDQSQFAAVIDGFYAQVAEALAEYDVKLSVVTTPQALDGTDTLTGQTPENLGLLDRIWIRDAEKTLVPLENAAQVPG